jgi:uracil-DNA glycosylase
MESYRAEKFAALVADVRACDLCKNLTPTKPKGDSLCSPRALKNVLAGNPEKHARGLGYWSDELGALNAAVMLVAQDPGSESYFLKAGPSHGAPGKRRWCDPEHAEKDFTWHNMLGYLAANEIDSRTCFTTNAVLCARTTEGSSGTAHGVWFRNCNSFLQRQIALVSPVVIAPLGEWATDYVFRALRQKPPGECFREMVEGPAIQVGDRNQFVVPLFHPMARPKDRTMTQQTTDYARIAAVLGRPSNNCP